MEIHVVQRGETIASIASRYEIPVSKLIEDNGLTDPARLVVGECIVIAKPEIVYTVQEGDTLESIAGRNGITVLQLVRNNPVLNDREFIYPGETLIISYGEKKGKILTNGYTNPFINKSILSRTLPYLTYLSIFGYRATEEANIEEIDDTEVISMAKEMGVAPILLLSTLTFEGVGSATSAFNILYNEELLELLVENLIRILRRKGYYGVNVSFLYITEKNYEIYNNLAKKLMEGLSRAGLELFISFTPTLIIKANNIIFQKIDYSKIGDFADYISIINYNWGFNMGPPSPVTSVTVLRQFLDYAVSLIPKEKIFVGMLLIGYAWQLPYILGVSKANSVTIDSAITLARETGSEILFDEVSQTPFFEFIEETTGVPREYIVWFVDARSVQAIMDLMTEYGFPGTGIWNIMTYFPQLWLIMNTQYEIETLLPVQ